MDPLSILILALVVIIVAFLLIYAVDLMGIGGRLAQLIKVLIVVIAALVIITRSGLL